MFKTFTLAAAALATLTIASAATAGESERRFTRDGQTFVYTVKPAAKGQVISGRAYPAGDSFRLYVRGGRVSGVSAGRPVSFTVEEARAPGTMVAAR